VVPRYEPTFTKDLQTMFKTRF